MHILFFCWLAAADVHPLAHLITLRGGVVRVDDLRVALERDTNTLVRIHEVRINGYSVGQTLLNPWDPVYYRSVELSVGADRGSCDLIISGRRAPIVDTRFFNCENLPAFPRDHQFVGRP